jgi:hypothetical protein
MVTFNDRPGGFVWGRGKPGILRNNKYSLMFRHGIPFVILFLALGKALAIGIAMAVDRMPYWEKRVSDR